MVDIKVSGRKVTVTDALRSYVDEKIGDALKVFDIKPMSCDVVLRVDKNPSNPDSQVVEVTVFVRDSVVRVVAAQADMYAAIDVAADKVTRQLVREKVIDLTPMTEEQALVEIDLIGHDFYVFTNATTGLTNVAYRRKNGGYGIIKPKIEEPDE